MAKILIVDDKAANRTLLKTVLAKASKDYTIIEADSGASALALVEVEKPDIILLDIIMPEMDGFEVCQKLKADKNYNAIPILFITAMEKPEDKVKGFEAGAVDYITKPFSPDEIKARISAHLRIKKAEDELVKMNRELEDRVEKRTKELKQSQAQVFQQAKLASLGEMATGVAHEINQPLGGIGLICKTISKQLEKKVLADADLKESLSEINECIQRITKIIKHIRTFARKDTLNFIEVDINDTIHSALTLFGEQLRRHSINVDLLLSDNLVPVLGEPYQLEQVWINLISNARSSLDEKEDKVKNGQLFFENYQKRIIISTTYLTSEKKVRVSFSDNGMGIAESNQKKIFEPFFTTKEVGKGTGLGLSISHGIISQHNGTINVESKESSGTLFAVDLTVDNR